MASEERIRSLVDHIVVVMMENRSFDHMLGYLALPESRFGSRDKPGSTVDGVDPGRVVTWGEKSYKAFALKSPTWVEPDYGDPPHDGDSVAWQVADPNRYIATYAARRPRAKTGAILGYLTADEVPVYDFLARNYCVCDKWFCSVPGATWPNRLFAVAGTAGGETDILETALETVTGGTPTVFRHLDRLEVSWRWYSSDPSLLRVFDPWYRLDDDRNRFAFFDEMTERQHGNFLTDARDGTLPQVSWVDPNFFKLPRLLDGSMPSNDDHPPHDVALGQKFINIVYEALRTGRNWERTMLIVTYDEHGGFYDHAKVPAPFGPRVPALVISPLVEPGRPCHIELEHTSIIKTILTKFDDTQGLEEMGPRVLFANDVWPMLTRTEPRRDCGPVTNPGRAKLEPGDLETRFLDWPGATIQRTLEALDERNSPTALQAELLHVFARLRGVGGGGAVSRAVAGIARRLPRAPRWVRVALRPALTRLPRRVRPMPERMP